MNRIEYMDWAKKRAIKYAEVGDFPNAFASFITDLEGHPETQNHPAIELFDTMFFSGNLNSNKSMIKFINDFA